MKEIFKNPYIVFFLKCLILGISFLLLIVKSDQPYSNIFLICLTLAIGYYLGKLTCNLNFKNFSLFITLFIFILMNILHSFIDGISIGNQPLIYGIGAIFGHELIRQPTLYILFWSILEPSNTRFYKKLILSFLAITLTWLLGIWLGKLCRGWVSHIYHASDLLGYGIFLFIGDIIHHLIDQYQFLPKSGIRNKLNELKDLP